MDKKKKGGGLQINAKKIVWGGGLHSVYHRFRRKILHRKSKFQTKSE